MTELELAQVVFGYDPDATPERELKKAEQSLREAARRCESDREILAELDDNAVYEWRLDTEHNTYVASKRDISKRTRKQIRLVSRYRGGRQTYLPRQQLEAGELVRQGTGWWLPDYALGWALRPHLETQLASSAQWLECCRNELETLELAFIEDELVITHDQRRTIEVIVGLTANRRQSDDTKASWLRDGF